MPLLLAGAGSVGAAAGGRGSVAPAELALNGAKSGNLSEISDTWSSSQIGAGKQQATRTRRLAPFARSSTIGVASGSLQDLKQAHQQHQQGSGSQLHQPTAAAAPTTTAATVQDNSNNNIGEATFRPISATSGAPSRLSSRNLNQHNNIVGSQQQPQGTSYQPQLSFQLQVQHQQSVAFSKATPNNTDSSNSALNDQIGSEQCNEQEHEDRPSCVQIMKKLFFSLVLGTVIAICWVMIIHTLKWVAIRGNEFESLQQRQQELHHQGSAGRAAELNAGTGRGAEISGADEMSPRSAVAAAAILASPKVLEAPSSYSEARISAQPIVDLASKWAQSEWLEEDSTSGGESQAKEEPKKGRIVGPASERQTRQLAEDGDDQDDDSTSISASTNGAGKDNERSPKILAASTSQLANERATQRKRLSHLNSISQRRPSTGAMPMNSAQQTSGSNGSGKGNKVADSRTQTMLLDLGSSQNEEPTLKSESANNNVLVGANMGDLSARPFEAPSNEAWIPSQVESQNGQSIETSSIERNAQVTGLIYKAPFFTSWFISIWNILFMPVFTLISSCCFRNEDSTTKKLLVESISQFMDNGLTTFQFLGRCAFFSLLWIGTIFGIVYSLANIDATVVMALFACSAALVYLLSWVLLHQQFVGVRIVAVIICTTGIALLAYMDSSRNTLGSVLMVAGSALCAAVYKVIYQRMFGFWSIAQMSLFFTLIGLFNALLMWPVVLLLYFLGVELLVWRYIPWMHLIASGALHLTANVVAYFGPICSYDVFLTMGLLFAVVLSAVIDVTFYKINFTGMKLAGVLLLMIGFLVCLLPENWNEFLYDLVNERFVRWKKQRNLKKSRNKVQDLSTGQMSRLRTPSGRVK